ncbi:hypothetical protein [Devosia aurantiaca]|uniref:Uncharacterized protein n=1 Tax=Devosia aurantiaca TaxID=2714858 RepID=A0A6M1SUU6_9HYPH|nr:hypothetical protein [Devosia aurantiaca]NGP19152.1 hypothetical protein [Devosia aurantiaca]
MEAFAQAVALGQSPEGPCSVLAQALPLGTRIGVQEVGAFHLAIYVVACAFNRQQKLAG